MATNSGIYLDQCDSCRIESNHITGVTSTATSYGIHTDYELSSATTPNLIIKNSCIGQDNNYEIDSNDTYGPEVSGAGALSTTGAASHPWANFQPLKTNPLTP